MAGARLSNASTVSQSAAYRAGAGRGVQRVAAELGERWVREHAALALLAREQLDRLVGEGRGGDRVQRHVLRMLHGEAGDALQLARQLGEAPRDLRLQLLVIAHQDLAHGNGLEQTFLPIAILERILKP